MSDSTEPGTATLVAGEKAHEIEGAPRSADTSAAGTSDVVARQREIQEEVRRDDRRQDPRQGRSDAGRGPGVSGAAVPRAAPGEAGAGGEARAGADVRRAVLEGLGQARGQGRADHRRRLRHRPGGRGAVRARGRRRGDRVSRRGRRRRGDQGRRRGRGTAGDRAPRRRRRPRLLPRGGGADGARARRGSTCWSTTPRSRCTPRTSSTSSPEHFDETLKTNLYGYFHMAQAAAAR